MITNLRKYIDKFKSSKNEPQVGDYVKGKLHDFDIEEVITFVQNNVGQIKKICKDWSDKKNIYVVKYNNIPSDLESEFTFIHKNGFYMDHAFSFYRKDLTFATPEEIKEYIIREETNKYNL